MPHICAVCHGSTVYMTDTIAWEHEDTAVTDRVRPHENPHNRKGTKVDVEWVIDTAHLITFEISGKAMGVIRGSEIYLSPAPTSRWHISTYDDQPAAHRATGALVAATSRKRGKGYTYTVRADRGAAEMIRDFCATVGDSYLGGTDDPEARAEGRALHVAAGRITLAIKP